MSVPRVLFTIGNFSIHLYGLMLALGLLTGTYLILKDAEKKRTAIREKIPDLILYLLISGLVGARALYVILNIDTFLSRPLSVFAVHQGGLAFHGALGAAVLVMVAFTRANRISFWAMSDLFAPGLAIGYAIVRIGCDIFGNVTNVPWAVTVGGAARHPVQLYSALAGYLIFILLLERRRKQHFTGEILLLFLFLYSFYRFVIEFFRSGTTLVGQILTPAQYLSIFIALAGLMLLAVNYKNLHFGVQREGREQWKN